MKKNLLLGAASVALMLGAAPAMADWSGGLGTGVNHNPLGPEYIITFAANGGITTVLNPVYTVDPGPFDGSDDTYFGVVNDTSKAITSFHIAGANIGAFDGDGVNASIECNGCFNPTAGVDNSGGGYGAFDAFYTNNTINALTVNFSQGISANGGIDVFSLESKASLSNIIITPGVPEPATWAMMMMGFAGLGFAAYRKARASASLA